MTAALDLALHIALYALIAAVALFTAWVAVVGWCVWTLWRNVGRALAVPEYGKDREP